MAATQIKKEESQAVGVYQLKNGLWAYRFIVKINGEQKTQRRSKDTMEKITGTKSIDRSWIN